MVFNFYWNIDKDDDESPDLTELMKELENLLQDWQNFFMLYAQYAPPPETNKEQIQAWFRELKKQHQKCVNMYKVSQGIQVEEPESNEMNEFFQFIQQQVREQTETKDGDEPDSMFG